MCLKSLAHSLSSFILIIAIKLNLSFYFFQSSRINAAEYCGSGNFSLHFCFASKKVSHFSLPDNNPE